MGSQLKIGAPTFQCHRSGVPYVPCEGARKSRAMRYGEKSVAIVGYGHVKYVNSWMNVALGRFLAGSRWSPFGRKAQLWCHAGSKVMWGISEDRIPAWCSAIRFTPLRSRQIPRNLSNLRSSEWIEMKRNGSCYRDHCTLGPSQLALLYIFWAKSWPESSPTHPTHLSPSPQLPPRSPWLTVSRRSQAGHVMGQAWWDLKFTLLDSLVLLQDGVEKQKTKVISWCKSTKRCEFQTIVRDSWVPSCLLILSFCIKIWRLADCRTHFDIVSVTI